MTTHTNLPAWTQILVLCLGRFWPGLVARADATILYLVVGLSPSVLAAAAPPSSTQAPDVIEVRAEGSINWSHHLWRVRGQSLPVSPALSFGGPIRQAGGALALARADVRTRLSKLRDVMFWGGVASPEVEATPRQSWGEGRAIDTQFYADGHVALTEDFGWDSAMAEHLWQARQQLPGQAQAPLGAAPVLDAAPPGTLVGVPTGLVVNARGLAVTPALLPQVQDETGQVLFSIRDVHPEALSRHGVARYSHSLDVAIKDERMGAHPAVVRALATKPQAPWIVVVDARQAAIVRAAMPSLVRARVIIVIDETARTSNASP